MSDERRKIEIRPLPIELGGGWRLRILENGEEVGGGVFPSSPDDPDGLESHEEAFSTGLEWVDSRA